MDLNFFSDIIHNYLSQFSFFADVDYYSGVIGKYWSVEGVLSAGVLAFLILVMSANEDNKKAGPIKALMGLVAVETSPVLMDILNSIVGVSYTTKVFDANMNPVNNIVSGFVLVLIMYSVYKFDEGFAFWTGILFYLITLLMNVNDYVQHLENKGILFAFIQYFVGAIVMGILCMNLCNRKYFYNAWIIYMIYHVVSRVIVAVLYACFVNGLSLGESITWYISFLSNHSKNLLLDIFIFGFVLMIAIIYERGVFKDIKESRVPPAPAETTAESE